MRSLVRALAPHIQNITIRRWTDNYKKVDGVFIVCASNECAVPSEHLVDNGVFIDCAKRALEQSK